MATRVRKLARELRRSPAEILGLLHELGYVRYRSTEDQIADVAAERVRDAVAKGVKAAPVEPVVEARPKATAGADAADWMAKIVPGVVRQRSDHLQSIHERPAPSARPPARPAPSTPAPSARPAQAPPPVAVPGASDVKLEVERARLEVERAALEALRAELVDARATLERATSELAEARAQVERTRRDVEQERIDLESARARLQAGGTALVEILEERGLRGADEQQRAIGALAAGRHLTTILPDLRVGDRGRLARLLEDRLVLVGGEVPAALQGVAAVTVAPARADLPDTREIEKVLRELGEQMLLNGLRRLIVVNAAPRWHKLLREGLDRRIELVFRPAPTRDVEVELTRVDVVALWRLDLPPDVKRTWQENVGRLVDVTDTSLVGFVAKVRDRLRSGG